MALEIPNADVDTLRMLADKFREKYPKAGAAVLVTGSTVIAVLTEDVVKRGLKAGDLITASAAKAADVPIWRKAALQEMSKRRLAKLPKVLEEKLK